MSLGGGVEKGKRDPNVPKIIFLLIKTYFSEYLRSERSPAARRSTCLIFKCFTVSMHVFQNTSVDRLECVNTCVHDIDQHISILVIDYRVSRSNSTMCR